jgi:hypothetical protein
MAKRVRLSMSTQASIRAGRRRHAVIWRMPIPVIRTEAVDGLDPSGIDGHGLGFLSRRNVPRGCRDLGRVGAGHDRVQSLSR